jgi:hypothetical protein
VAQIQIFKSDESFLIIFEGGLIFESASNQIGRVCPFEGSFFPGKRMEKINFGNLFFINFTILL